MLIVLLYFIVLNYFVLYCIVLYCFKLLFCFVLYGIVYSHRRFPCMKFGLLALGR